MPPEWGEWVKLYELKYETDLTKRADTVFSRPNYWTWINASWEVMMMKQGLIPEEDHRKIAGALLELWENPELSHQFAGTKAVIPFVEDRHGIEVAGNLSMARTNPPFRQMFPIRWKGLKVIALLHDIQEALLDAAERHKDAVMVGYTHMRHAQPTTLGHYLLSVHDGLSRGVEQVEYGYKYVNANLLGCGALAGTSLEIDRKLVTRYLGMEDEVENSNDCMAYIEAYVPLVAGLTMTMDVVSRISLELGMWTGREYNFIDLEGYGAHSFMMPNKRDNPGILERNRQAAAIMAGLLTEVSMMGTRAPYGDTYEMIGYDATLSYDLLRLGDIPGTIPKGNAVIRALYHAHSNLNTFPHIISSIRAKEQKMLETAREGYSSSTELANELKRNHGVDYRTAHEIVNRFVKESIRKEIPAYLADVNILEKAARDVTGSKLGMTEENLRLALDPEHFVEVTDSQGGVAPSEVSRMVTERRKDLREARARHEAILEKMEQGHQTLYEDLQSIYNGSN